MSGRITVLSQRSIHYFKSTGFQSSWNRYVLDTLSYAVEARDCDLVAEICRHQKLPRICVHPGDDTWQQSPLYEAVNTGQDSIVDTLLKSVDLKGIEKLMGRCLVTAIGQRNRQIVELLVGKGCDVNYEYDSESPLAKACMVGDIDMAEFIRNNGGVIFGEGVLKSAAGRGYEKAAEKIVEWAEPNRDEVLVAIGEACKKGQCRVVDKLIGLCKPELNMTEILNIATEALKAEKYDAVKVVLSLSLDKLGDDEKRDDLFQELLNLVASEDSLVPEVLMQFAVIIENEEAVLFCIKHGLEIELLVNGVTAFHLAVMRKQDNIIGLIMTSIKNVDCLDKKGRTPLNLACEVGCTVETVQMLADSGARITSTDKESKTPLMHASEAGHKELVEILIKSNADVNAKDAKFKTALHHAAGRNRAYAAHQLIEAGADLSVFDDKNNSPLHEACRAGAEEIVEMILERVKSGKVDFEVNARNANGSTALHLASDAGDLDTVRMLFSHGVDALVVDNEGRTALHVGSWKDDLVTILLGAGIDVDAVDCEGETALYKACQCDPEKPNVIRELITGGADVNVAAKNQETPLIVACRNTSVDTVGLLLEANVDVNYHLDGIDCALIEVCKYCARGLSLQSCQRPHTRQTRIAQWLLEHRADVVTWGEAALEEACFAANNISLLKTLLEKLPSSVSKRWLQSAPVFRLIERNLSHNFRHKRYAIVYTVQAISLLVKNGAIFGLNHDCIVDLYEWNLFVSAVVFSLSTPSSDSDGKIPTRLFETLNTNGDTFTIELLLENGFEIPSEESAYISWRGNPVTTECPAPCQTTDDLAENRVKCRNVKSLKSMCRMSLRSTLNSHPGRTFLSKILELNLPSQLMDYLTFVKLPRI